jgi:[acyl-carrier-protein] S-malonyltransferase
VVEENNSARAFVFPGQGSQQVGMGADWAELFPASAEVFRRADEVLGFALSKLCWLGPEEELRLTANTQPAILTTSVAMLRAIHQTGLRPAAVAGHSLGEYSALVAAEVLSFEDALRLVRRRGELMQEAVPVGVGAMAAVMGLAPEVLEEVTTEAAEDQVCSVANLNSPVQIVIAGHREAVERAVRLAEERGAKRAMLLPVSAPFHCALMGPAREALTPLLEDTRFSEPVVPVISNYAAETVASGAQARDALIRQIESPVRWVESVRRMESDHGVSLFLEVGPGKVLTGLNRRIVAQAEARSLGSPSDLEQQAKTEENNR